MSIKNMVIFQLDSNYLFICTNIAFCLQFEKKYCKTSSIKINILSLKIFTDGAMHQCI